MEKALVDTIRHLTGAEPKKAQLEMAAKLREQFRFSPDDPVWAFLLVSGHYESVLKEAPAAIAAAVEAVRTQAEEVAAAESKRVADLVKGDLVRAFQDGLGDYLRRVSVHLDWRRFLAVAGASTIAVVLALATSFAIGKSVARSEAAGALAWLDSAPGRAAREFARLNDPEAIMACDGYERVEKDGRAYCRPVRERMIYGWRVK